MATSRRHRGRKGPKATSATPSGWQARLKAASKKGRWWGAYSRYLKSPEWKGRRLGALERAGRRCLLCQSDERLEVHHATYARVGAEWPEDLRVLCRGCHKLHHASPQRIPMDAETRRLGEERAVKAATEPAAVPVRVVRRRPKAPTKEIFTVPLDTVP